MSSLNPDASTQEVVDDIFDADLGEAKSQFRWSPGDHPGICVALDKDVSKAGNDMWVFTFACAAGADEGKELKTYCALTPAALWKLEEVVVALGLGKPGEKLRFKKGDAIGRACMLSVEDQEYNGKLSSTIAQVKPHPQGPAALKAKTNRTPF